MQVVSHGPRPVSAASGGEHRRSEAWSSGVARCMRGSSRVSGKAGWSVVAPRDETERRSHSNGLGVSVSALSAFAAPRVDLRFRSYRVHADGSGLTVGEGSE